MRTYRLQKYASTKKPYLVVACGVMTFNTWCILLAALMTVSCQLVNKQTQLSILQQAFGIKSVSHTWNYALGGWVGGKNVILWEQGLKKREKTWKLKIVVLALLGLFTARSTYCLASSWINLSSTNVFLLSIMVFGGCNTQVRKQTIRNLHFANTICWMV